MTHVPEAAFDLARQHEGLKLKAYKCPAGIWTIGYGRTGDDVREGLVITEAVADEWLRQDLEDAARGVDRLVKVTLTENERAALIDFVFNLGAGRLAASTLLKLLNSRDYEAASLEFPKWVYGGGIKLPGLVVRRDDERALFTDGMEA